MSDWKKGDVAKLELLPDDPNPYVNGDTVWLIEFVGVPPLPDGLTCENKTYWRIEVRGSLLWYAPECVLRRPDNPNKKVEWDEIFQPEETVDVVYE